jgi:hypothetical protein
MPVVELLQTHPKCTKTAKSFTSGGLSELRALCRMSVVELLQTHREVHEDREEFYEWGS